MKNLLKLSLVFLLLFSACSKDNNEEVIAEVEEIEEGVSTELMTNLFNSARTATTSNQESDYVDDGECFIINYPYNVSDGQTSTTLNSDEELLTFLETLTEESEVYIEVPFDVTLADGSQQTISTYEELEELFEDCYDFDDDDDNDYEEECFELNYPLTALDYDGNEVVVNSEQDLYNFEFVGFVYPRKI